MAALAHDLYTGSITVNQHGGPVEFQLRDCLQQLVAKQKPKPFEMCLGVICLARIRKSVVAVWHLEPHPIAWVFALLAQACLLTGFYNLLLIETSCCHTHRNVSGGLRPDPSQDDLTEHPRGVDAKVSLAGVCLKTSKNACADLAAARTVRERGKKRGELIAAKQGAYVKGGGLRHLALRRTSTSSRRWRRPPAQACPARPSALSYEIMPSIGSLLLPGVIWLRRPWELLRARGRPPLPPLIAQGRLLSLRASKDFGRGMGAAQTCYSHTYPFIHHAVVGDTLPMPRAPVLALPLAMRMQRKRSFAKVWLTWWTSRPWSRASLRLSEIGTPAEPTLSASWRTQVGSRTCLWALVFAAACSLRQVVHVACSSSSPRTPSHC